MGRDMMPLFKINRAGKRNKMATYILVHGAWHGGWCYRETAHALRMAGHEVFSPTLTGLGDKAHHRSSHGITLETHILDICELMDRKNLQQVILCGHCYGGMVISGAADRMPQRIRSLVYIDAFVPEHWQSVIGLLDGMPPSKSTARFIAEFRDSAVDSFEMPILLTGAAARIKDRHYLAAKGWSENPFRKFEKSLEGNPAWRIRRFNCGHDIMVDMPLELACELEAVAQGITHSVEHR